MHLGNIEVALREFFLRKGEDTRDWHFEITNIKEEGDDLSVSFYTTGDGWKTYETLIVEEEDGEYFARL